MSKLNMLELIAAGVHFGHPVRSWNPKMKPYIFGKRNLIHIIDVKSTLRGLIQACHFLHEIALMGEEILIIGTKRQSRQIVEDMGKNLNMPYVCERWLGGMLTNYGTIRERLKRLETIESMEETGLIHTFSKKMISSLMREKKKIQRNLQGVRYMTKLPGALVIVDPKREYIAVKEALKLNIPVVAIIDTDSDPDLIDISIPGNDDAYRSISTLLGILKESIGEGLGKFKARMDILKKQEEERAAAEAKRAADAAEAKKAREAKRAAEAAEARKAAEAARAKRAASAKKDQPSEKEGTTKTRKVAASAKSGETKTLRKTAKVVTPSKTGKTARRKPKVKSKESKEEPK